MDIHDQESGAISHSEVELQNEDIDAVKSVDVRDLAATLRTNKPPVCSGPMYLALIDRVLNMHQLADILPTLCEILQDAEMAQLLGWNLMPVLLERPGSEDALHIIARLGNPREIVLGVNEALIGLELEDEEEEASETPQTDKFCLLLNLFAIILPRIKTKYPSRFLATTLMQINDHYLPTRVATLAVIHFLRTISGQKRPPLPGRKSSRDMTTLSHKPAIVSGPVEPDPQAEQEDPSEAAIQERLLHGFVTHLLEQYVNANPLEWASRLLEAYDPDKVVAGRKTLSESFRDEPSFMVRDPIVGQLVALCSDLGLHDNNVILKSIHQTYGDEPPLDPSENLPNSPEDIPLSSEGCLFLITSFVFSAEIFGSKTSLPSISVFPDHAKLVVKFKDSGGSGVTDAILAIGLWLEHSDKFVAGPLDDDEFLDYLNVLSGLSAVNPSPTLRYAAHVLTSSILHSHPNDRVRLSFISSFLEEELEPPLNNLAVSAITWLKEEIIRAEERGSKNVFSSHVALQATVPFVSLDVTDTTHGEASLRKLMQSLSFHMTAVNFLFFLQGEQYVHLLPEGMVKGVQESYLSPLRELQKASLVGLRNDGAEQHHGVHVDQVKVDLELLGDRIEMAYSKTSKAS